MTENQEEDEEKEFYGCIFHVKATWEPLIQYPSQQNNCLFFNVPLMKWFGRQSWVGQWERWLSGLCHWGGQWARPPSPLLPWLCVPLSLYTKTICFSCSNEEQCLTDKGASSLLLCCLWLGLDAGRNGNSQCECFFSSHTGYSWACTLYVADGTIVNSVRTRKEWITTFFPPFPESQEIRNFFTMIFIYACMLGYFLSNILCRILINNFFKL